LRIVSGWLTAALLPWLCGAALAAPIWSYRVVATYPHDPGSFTEGLAIRGDRLYESAGQYGASKITVRRLRSGELLNQFRLPDSDFGEGMTIAGRKLVQLTLHHGIGYEYDLGLRLKRRFTISTEGWGLAWTGRELIRSDGSPVLRVLDPRDYRELRQVTVQDLGVRINQLNELEYAQGRLWANVWLTDAIAAIDPAGGSVLGWLDLSALQQSFDKPASWDPQDDVLNGIAWDPASRHFFVTGKCWPRLFEIAVDTDTVLGQSHR
jgi:glutaminyl-peptide cyclotransferase